ncbi:MAG: non-hydrolyzing UDP-N-acetylglucosamine 2-epimerase [Bacteroidota bacterium]
MAHIEVVVGTRPNVVKAAPLCKALLRQTQCEPHLLVVHQHTDANMLQMIIKELNLQSMVPIHDVYLRRATFHDRDDRLQELRGSIQSYWETNTPDMVVAIGDVDTTLATAQAASELGLPLVHVEAGLRSNNPEMAEEHNRMATDQLSDLLLVTKPYATQQLLHEGFKPHQIVETGNVALDAMELVRPEPIREQSEKKSEGLTLLLTLHRAENVDRIERLSQLPRLLDALVSKLPVDGIWFPVHPRTQKRLEEFSIGEQLRQIEQLNCLPPLGYVEFIRKLSAADGVLTDSGGVQEESTFLKKPCVVLRTETEHEHAMDLDYLSLFPLSEVESKVGQIVNLLQRPTHPNELPRSTASASMRAAKAINRLAERLQMMES